MAPGAWREVRRGLADTWLVGLGLVPLGIAFGLVVTHAGFAWWWAPIFSVLIYAGSSEFLAVEMVTAGVGPVASALTGFMVNFRHLVYGLTFPRHLIRSQVGRAYSTYALTDESYAIASAVRPDSGARVLSIQVLCQAVWVLSGILGALAGQIIPPSIQGMDFALTALFVVLAYETFRSSRDYSAVLIAGAIAVAAAVVAPDQMLLVSLPLFFLVLLARFWNPGLDKKLTWRAK
ncbi:Inner membrane protein YgaZ [Corynebacterium capitovis DSM 44611]|uniref:AzlC family ABC transporter permease n=1 Tax=Corynebacterium capitovis TaxID=131081 RepID=UPI000381AF18|nr:AzlC family ABC transporter permease [Corynebacterium capitovis]WKD58423.1 Inner membrane protein YgaZ [Corynebacterium capitovis DSM 44611]